MLLEEGRMEWEFFSPFSIRILPPCLGEVVRFGFASFRHGEANIFFLMKDINCDNFLRGVE